MCFLIHICCIASALTPSHRHSFGLVPVYTSDNAKLLQAFKPLLVTYYAIDATKDVSGFKYIRNRCVSRLAA